MRITKYCVTLYHCYSVTGGVKVILKGNERINDTVAYLPHERKAEPQNQPLLNNTRTNNGTAGLHNPFLGYGSVNTLHAGACHTPTILAGSHVTCPWSDIRDATIQLGFLCGRRGGYIA
jgi:hypothetical protein